MLTAQTFIKRLAPRESRGFTLIELMVVISVIAILATISLFGLNKAQASARDVSRQQIMSGIRIALERYYADKGVYPTQDLVAGQQWSGNPASPIDVLVAGRYLTAAPTDPCLGGTVILGTGKLTGGVCNDVPLYSYTQTTTADYTLTLTKEGGGTSTLKSPQ